MNAEKVYLVMDADRDVLDVCVDEGSAQELAKAQDATVEEWPVSRNARSLAWDRALRLASSLRSGKAVS